MIVEDDPYGALHFDDAASASDTRPIKADDADGRVVYLSSFSKTVAPGFRVAWIAAPPAITAKLEVAKQAADLCTGALDQRIVYEVWKRGVIAARLPALRAYYQEKRRVMEGALQRELGDLVSWPQPRGGFFLWVSFDGRVDTDALLQRAIAHSVVYVAGSAFFVDGRTSSHARLSFSAPSHARIDEGAANVRPPIRLDPQNADLDDPVGGRVESSRLEVDYCQGSDQRQVAKHDIDLRCWRAGRRVRQHLDGNERRFVRMGKRRDCRAVDDVACRDDNDGFEPGWSRENVRRRREFAAERHVTRGRAVLELVSREFRRESRNEQRCSCPQRTARRPEREWAFPSLIAVAPVERPQHVVERHEIHDVLVDDRQPNHVCPRSPRPIGLAGVAFQAIEKIIVRADEESFVDGQDVACGSAETMFPDCGAGVDPQRNNAAIFGRNVHAT